jgi:hypothetical protein
MPDQSGHQHDGDRLFYMEMKTENTGAGCTFPEAKTILR